MKTSEALYAAADYMREHGFHPAWTAFDGSNCGCFAHALFAVACTSRGIERIEAVIGASIDRDELLRLGWVKDCTDDAVAALEIAADIACAEGQ